MRNYGHWSVSGKLAVADTLSCGLVSWRTGELADTTVSSSSSS